jgi:regulator of replication initiation timing
MATGVIVHPVFANLSAAKRELHVILEENAALKRKVADLENRLSQRVMYVPMNGEKGEPRLMQCERCMKEQERIEEVRLLVKQVCERMGGV